MIHLQQAEQPASALHAWELVGVYAAATNLRPYYLEVTLW